LKLNFQESDDEEASDEYGNEIPLQEVVQQPIGDDHHIRRGQLNDRPEQPPTGRFDMPEDEEETRKHRVVERVPVAERPAVADQQVHHGNIVKPVEQIREAERLPWRRPAESADDQDDYHSPQLNNVDEPFSIKASADVVENDVMIPATRVTIAPLQAYSTVDYSEEDDLYGDTSQERKRDQEMPHRPPSRVTNAGNIRPIVEPSRPPSAWDAPRWPAVDNHLVVTPAPTYRTYRPVQIKTVDLRKIVPTTSTTTTTRETTTKAPTTTTTTTTTTEPTTTSTVTTTARIILTTSTHPSTTTSETTTSASTTPLPITTTVTIPNVPLLTPIPDDEAKILETEKHDDHGDERDLGWGLTGNTKRPSHETSGTMGNSGFYFVMLILTTLLTLLFRF